MPSSLLYEDQDLRVQLQGDATAIGADVSVRILHPSQASFYSIGNGLRKGVRIVDTDNGGIVEITSVDANGFNVKGIVTSAWASVVRPGYVGLTKGNQVGWVYEDSSNWEILVPRALNSKKYLPFNMRTKKFFPEIISAYDEEVIDEVRDGIHRVRNLRDWRTMDSDYLGQAIRNLGLTIATDQYSEDVKRRIVRDFKTFIEIAGTEQYTDLLGFVVGGVLRSEPLWTSDYVDFIRKDEIPSGQESDYYPTNHVTLIYDATKFSNLSDRELRDVFYILASLVLVLENIIQETVSPLTVAVSADVGKTSIYYTSSIVE